MALALDEVKVHQNHFGNTQIVMTLTLYQGGKVNDAAVSTLLNYLQGSQAAEITSDTLLALAQKLHEWEQK